MLLAAGMPLLLAIAGIAVGFALLAPAQRDHADVGVVDELLDDDRPRGRHRLQPVHRQPLPRGTRRGQGRDRRDREHDVDRRQGRVPLGADRRAVARRGVPRAGHGVPLDGARHDPLGRRRRARVAHAAARACSSRLGDRVLVTKNTETPTSPPRVAVAALDRRRAAPPRPVLAIGLVVLGALIAPAFGMHLGMPGARVVDTGHTSRDGYDMLVDAFGPGAAAPAFITTPAADAADVIASRRPYPASSTPASSPRPQRPAGSSCASSARPRSTTPAPRRS